MSIKRIPPPAWLTAAIVALFLIGGIAYFSPDSSAQRTASNPLGAQLNVQDAGTCSTTNSFAWQTLPTNAGTTTVNLSGTFSGTLTIRLSNNGGASWTTNSTTTTAGTTSIATNGFTDVCADVTSYTSGTFQVSITTGLNVIQSVVTTQTQSSSTSGNYPANTIDTTASKYATPIGNTIPDATFTSGQNTIDCSFNSDCNFVAALDNGKTCFGTNLTTDISILNLTAAVLPEGTLTVTDAQHATCSGGNSTATTVHNGVFVWGKLGHTQLNLAWADCIALNGCSYMLPPGPVLVEAAVGTAQCGGTAAMTPCTEAFGYSRIQVNGYGQVISQLIPTPNFSGASCTGGLGSSCFFSGAGVNLSNFGIFGAGVAVNTNLNGKNAIEIQGNGNYNSYISQVMLLDWACCGGTMVGLRADSQSAIYIQNLLVDGAGSPNCTLLGNFISLIGSICGVSGGTSNMSIGATYVSSFGGLYGWTPNANNTGAVQVNSGIFYSVGDTMPYTVGPTTLAAEVYCNAGATCYLNGDYLTATNGSTNGAAVQPFSTQGTYASNSHLQGQAYGVVMNSTGKFVSLGGNFITGATKSYNTTSFGGASTIVIPNPTDILSGASDLIPTFTSTGTGTVTCVPTAETGSDNQHGTFTCTAATGAVATGTFVLTFNGTFALVAAGNPPTCSAWLKNGTGSWNIRATLIENASTPTSYTWNWDNNGVSLTAASTYKVGYTCSPR